MSAASRFPEAEAILAAWAAAQDAVEGYSFPALTVETVTDDGETYEALRCPWCDSLITGDDDLSAVDVSERWNSSRWVSDEDFDRKRISFDFTGDDDYGDTLYVRCDRCQKPVSLPHGWTVGSAL